MLKVINKSLVEPINLQEAKNFLRIDHNHEDELLNHLIASSRELVERHTGRLMITQTVGVNVPFRPQTESYGLMKGGQSGGSWNQGGKTLFYLPAGPVQKIVNIYLIKENGGFETIPNEKTYFNPFLDPGLLSTEVSEGWGLYIVYTAGYGDFPDSVPSLLKQGIFTILANLYENREEGDKDIMKKCELFFEPYYGKRMTL